MMIDNEHEEIPFGNFIIEKPENQEVRNKTEFVGYDYMIKFNNKKYVDSNTYPTTIGKVFDNLCKQVGLEAGNLYFTNYDFEISGNPFEEGTEVKIVLSEIAKLAGGFAHIGRDNKVYIINPKNIINSLRVKDVHSMSVKELDSTQVKYLRATADVRVKDVDIMPVRRLTLKQIKYLTGTKKNSIDFRIDGNSYFDDFTRNDVWGELNSLTLSVSNVEGEYNTIQDTRSIEKNGKMEFVIEDSVFLATETDRKKAIEPIWENLKGLNYLPFKASYYGYPQADAGDIIYISDTKDKRYISFIFNHKVTFNSGYSGEIETQALTKAQVEYKNTNTLKNRFKKVELSVDKANGRITAEVGRIDDNLTETNAKLEITDEKITSEVSRIDSNLEETSSKIQQTNEKITTEVSSLSNRISNANSKIEQTASSIRTEVSKKVGNDEIISKINQSAEEIQIEANKISLEGKEINLTSDDVVIKSNNFNVDKTGKMTCKERRVYRWKYIINRRNSRHS